MHVVTTNLEIIVSHLLLINTMTTLYQMEANNSVYVQVYIYIHKFNNFSLLTMWSSILHKSMFHNQLINQSCH